MVEVNVLDFMRLFPRPLINICRTCFPFSFSYFEGMKGKNLQETEVTKESKVAEEKVTEGRRKSKEVEFK